jgi:hypothetical protein
MVSIPRAELGWLCASFLCGLGSEVPVYLGSEVPEYVVSRHSDLLDGTLFSLAGSAAVAGGIVHAWRARQASGSVPWPDLLLGRARQAKSRLGEPLLLEPPPLKQYELLMGIFYVIVGLAFAAVGVWQLLAGFGIGGPVYTPDAPG